ncbi:MAG TPA: hypothetical protein VIY73_06535, partial [Polyangiaceae bacterium]
MLAMRARGLLSLVAAFLAVLAADAAPRRAHADPPTAAPTTTAAAPAPVAPGTPVVVAAMGDSLSDPRVGGGKYLDRLRARCPRSRFDSYGKGGEMVNQMRRRFEREVFAPGNPAYTHVIVFGGV